MIKVSIFCDQVSISDRDRWVVEKMYKNQVKTFDEWCNELKDKIVFILPEKISTFVSESDDKPKSTRSNSKKQ